MKRIKSSIHIITISLIMISCKNDHYKNYIITQPKNDTIYIKNFVINEYQKSNNKFLYSLYLEMDCYKNLDKTLVESLSLIINESTFTVEGIEVLFSREIPDSDFFFTQENNTKYVNIDTINRRKLVGIWAESKSINDIINLGVKIDTIRTFSDKLIPEVFLEVPQNNN